jgi:hypothetical protein
MVVVRRWAIDNFVNLCLTIQLIIIIAKKDATPLVSIEDGLIGGPRVGSIIEPNEPWIALPQRVWPVLRHLSFHLASDAILFAKLCRTLKHLLVLQKKAEQKQRPTENKDSRDAKITAAATALGLNNDDTMVEISPEFEDIIADVLLPSFSLMSSSMGLSSDVWSLFKEMPYQVRVLHLYFSSATNQSTDMVPIGFVSFDTVYMDIGRQWYMINILSYKYSVQIPQHVLVISVSV